VRLAVGARSGRERNDAEPIRVAQLDRPPDTLPVRCRELSELLLLSFWRGDAPLSDCTTTGLKGDLVFAVLSERERSFLTMVGFGGTLRTLRGAG
jgi:hypothetical protein